MIHLQGHQWPGDLMGKQGKTDDVLVFSVRRDTKCGECGCELSKGSLIRLEEGPGALCLSCADLDHLDFLAPGNAALTRRARKHSRLSAIVLRWSSARKRYERRGILAEPQAIDQAEAECLDDAEERAVRRERAQTKRQEQDQQYVAEFARQISQLYPGCPVDTARAIAAHACRKYSGRVGRSAAAKQFDPEPITLAVAAWVRHNRTDYDDLLAASEDRHEARRRVRADVDEILAEWAGEPQ